LGSAQVQPRDDVNDERSFHANQGVENIFWTMVVSYLPLAKSGWSRIRR
jgi:hypothetical protein